MKRRITAASALVLVTLLSIATFTPAGRAQQPRRFRADTGVITLGMGQVLRLTVNGLNGNDAFRVRFAWMKYMPSGCNNDGVCRHTVQSQGITAPVNIGTNEAASFEMQGTGGSVRVSVFVAAGDVTGDAEIINTATGEVTSHVIMANTEG
jgi:hypothetical protein